MSLNLDKIINSIENADKEGILFGSEVLSGYSGEKIIGVLQRFLSLLPDNGDACYLEVGVYQGLTLLSTALANPEIRCYGIDNFAFFDPNGQNYSLVKERIGKLNLNNVEIINKDYELAFNDLKEEIGSRTIGIYFIDGPHDYRSQIMCLQMALPYLSEDSIIIVDDCNYEHVKQANADFLKTNQNFNFLQILNYFLSHVLFHYEQSY